MIASLSSTTLALKSEFHQEHHRGHNFFQTNNWPSNHLIRGISRSAVNAGSLHHYYHGKKAVELHLRVISLTNTFKYLYYTLAK